MPYIFAFPVSQSSSRGRSNPSKLTPKLIEKFIKIHQIFQLQRSQRCFTICFSKSLHSKKFEASIDFHVMGFKLKLIYPSLIGYGFMKLVRSVTEKSEEREEASEPFLFSTRPGSVNKTGSDASSFSSDFSVAEGANVVKPYPMREGKMSFNLSPIT